MNRRTTTLAAALIAAVLTCTAATAEELNFAGTLNRGDETLEEGELVDTYKLELKAGTIVDLTMVSDDFDAYLIVVPPEGEQLDNDDAFEDDYNARLHFVARETGTYEILATTSTPGERGKYTITGTTTRCRMVKRQDGELTDKDEFSWVGGEYFDRYTLELKPGEQRAISLDSEDFDTWLTIHTPEGEVILVDGYPTVYILEAGKQGGAYTLVVSSLYSKEVGKYRLEYHAIIKEDAGQN